MEQVRSARMIFMLVTDFVIVGINVSRTPALAEPLAGLEGIYFFEQPGN
jgi:hypothetical protein